MPREIAEAIRDAVRSHKKKMTTIAAESGIGVAVLSRFMREERTITVETAEKLFAYLGLKVQKKSEEKS